MRILAIDAWRYDHGWTWNNWFHVGDVESLPDSSRALLKLLREEGYLSNLSKGRVAIEDDGNNTVIVEKGTRRPLLAIEYGF